MPTATYCRALGSFALAALFLPYAASAQSLEVGIVDVRIGASVPDVVPRLKAMYTVVEGQLGDGDTFWQVSDRPLADGGKAFGFLIGNGGKIVTISQIKEVGNAALPEAFKYWLLRLRELGGATCSTTPEVSAIGLAFATACGRYRLVTAFPTVVDGKPLGENPTLTLTVR